MGAMKLVLYPSEYDVVGKGTEKKIFTTTMEEMIP